MKYAILVLEGAAQPLSGRADESGSALQRASMPAASALARAGRVGLAQFIPEDQDPIAGFGLAALLGINPEACGLTTAALDAQRLGVDTPGITATLTLAATASSPEPARVLGHVDLPDHEASVLFADLAAMWQSEGFRVAVHHVSGSRAILVDESGALFRGVLTDPLPIGRVFEKCLPAGGTEPGEAQYLADLVRSSHQFLSTHEINQTRAELGLEVANLAWLTDPAPKPQLPQWDQIYGLNACVICDEILEPVLRPIAQMLSLQVQSRQSLEQITDSAARALDPHDVVIICLDVSSIQTEPREPAASPLIDPLIDLRARQLEVIDRVLVGPIAATLASSGIAATDSCSEPPWRIMLVASALTATDEPGRVLPGPVPFAISGGWIRSVVERTWTEAEAISSDVYIARGHELMEYFLFSGLKRTTRTANARAQSPEKR